MIDLATLILYYYDLQAKLRTPAEQGIETTELIWSLHTLFGHFHFCDASNGKFLDLAENYCASSLIMILFTIEANTVV